MYYILVFYFLSNKFVTLSIMLLALSAVSLALTPSTILLITSSGKSIPITFSTALIGLSLNSLANFLSLVRMRWEIYLTR